MEVGRERRVDSFAFFVCIHFSRGRRALPRRARATHTHTHTHTLVRPTTHLARDEGAGRQLPGGRGRCVGRVSLFLLMPQPAGWTPPPTPLLPALPPDMVRSILACLGAADLGVIATTCRALATAAAEDGLWRGVAERAGWADPLVRARLGRHADRAAAIGDAAGAAYLAAHARGAGRLLTWRDRCRVSAGVACVGRHW